MINNYILSRREVSKSPINAPLPPIISCREANRTSFISSIGRLHEVYRGKRPDPLLIRKLVA